jgi:hypothetical protein
MVFLTPGAGIKGNFPLGMAVAMGVVVPVGSFRRIEN